MRIWSRRRLSSVSLALLVAIASLSVPHGAEPGHDPDFAGFVARHGCAVVVSAPASPDSETVHCLACHWARAFRPTVEQCYSAQPADESQATGTPRPLPDRRSAQASQPSLRSPPHPSLLLIHA